MFRRIFATALIAGFLGGAGITVVQEATTTPLIRHAEVYEKGAVADPDSRGVPGPRASLVPKAFGHDALAPHLHAAGRALAHETAAPHGHLAGRALAHGVHDAVPFGEGAEPEIERLFLTTLANVLTATGFALILVACFALAGRPVGGREGLLWGIGGFATVSLAPALGLPPEVPGAMAAELGARQGWWILCVVATAAGLWLLVFRNSARWALPGVLLIVAPHLVGAPQPPEIGGAAPPELAAYFVAASLVTAAVFWAGLGWLSGTFWNRFRTG